MHNPNLHYYNSVCDVIQSVWNEMKKQDGLNRRFKKPALNTKMLITIEDNSIFDNMLILPLKLLLLWVMTGSYVGFGTCMKIKKHLCIYLYLISSQTIHLSKPLLRVTLLCSDWSISFKAEHSVTYKSCNKWAGLCKCFNIKHL